MYSHYWSVFEYRILEYLYNYVHNFLYDIIIFVGVVGLEPAKPRHWFYRPAQLTIVDAHPKRINGVFKELTLNLCHCSLQSELPYHYVGACAIIGFALPRQFRRYADEEGFEPSGLFTPASLAGTCINLTLPLILTHKIKKAGAF